METARTAIAYESALPWNPERPDTTIITCVDGRWYHHFQEFARVHLNAGARTDFLAVPGGIVRSSQPWTSGGKGGSAGVMPAMAAMGFTAPQVERAEIAQVRRGGQRGQAFVPDVRAA